MRGYKGMNADMTCRGVKFEVGKEYTVRGNIKLCRNGFHFCQRLKDVFYYYAPEKASRYFEVEAAGKVLIEGSKAVAKTLRIVREVDPREVWRIFYGGAGVLSLVVPIMGKSDHCILFDGDGSGCGCGYEIDCGNGVLGYGNGGGYVYGNIFGHGYGGGSCNGTLTGTGRGNGPIGFRSRQQFNKIGIFK